MKFTPEKKQLRNEDSEERIAKQSSREDGEKKRKYEQRGQPRGSLQEEEEEEEEEGEALQEEEEEEEEGDERRGTRGRNESLHVRSYFHEAKGEKWEERRTVERAWIGRCILLLWVRCRANTGISMRTVITESLTHPMSECIPH